MSICILVLGFSAFGGATVGSVGRTAFAEDVVGDLGWEYRFGKDCELREENLEQVSIGNQTCIYNRRF